MKKYVDESLCSFLFFSQLADKKLMRNIGNNYDFTGRKVRGLINKNIIEERVLDLPYRSSYISLSSKATNDFVLSHNIDKDFYNKIRSRIKGTDNKYRQLKLSMTLQMFYKYFPEYFQEYYDIERKILDGSFSTTIDDEIRHRKQRSDYGEFFITLKEMRDIDEYNLRKLTSTRAQGICEFNNNRYVIYNHDKKRMRGHGDFEEKFNDYFQILFGIAPTGAIHFGRSYKIPLDTLFKTAVKQRSQFVITKDIYNKNFFVPLNHSGEQQLLLYTIPDFRNKIRNELLLKEEMQKAKNVFYDGIDKDGNIIYIAFECDITEIEKIQHTLDTVKISSDLILYCLPHQIDFYKKVFGERVNIKILTVEEICEVLK